MKTGRSVNAQLWWTWAEHKAPLRNSEQPSKFARVAHNIYTLSPVSKVAESISSIRFAQKIDWGLLFSGLSIGGHRARLAFGVHAAMALSTMCHRVRHALWGRVTERGPAPLP